LKQARTAIVPPLQAVGITTGGCRRGGKNHRRKCGGSNVNFLS
jgi:hypothetical protein